MRAFAIDLGGTHAKCAVVADRQILATRVVDATGSSGMRELLPRLAAALHELASETRLVMSDFDGVVLGFCGLIDSESCRILSTNKKYEDAPVCDLPAWARKEFGLPLHLENDARMALMGEHYAGAARDTSDVVMVTLGTGIGGAAMIGGRLLRGKHHQAGCLGGHLPVRFDGRPCTCGGIGCAESEAATWSLPLVCREWAGFETSILIKGEINFQRLFSCAASGDRVAAEIREHCLTVWAVNAVSLIHAYDPELLVYGGGIMASGNEILPYIQAYVAKHAWTPWGTVKVRAAQLGADSALLGAVPLLVEQ